jgi:hypothetical protein
MIISIASLIIFYWAEMKCRQDVKPKLSQRILRKVYKGRES